MRLCKYLVTFYKREGEKEHNLGQLTLIQKYDPYASVAGRAFRLANALQQNATRLQIQEIK